MFRKTDKDNMIILLQKENKKLIKENINLTKQVESFEDLRIEYGKLIEELKQARDDCISMKLQFDEIEKVYRETLSLVSTRKLQEK